MRHRFWTAALVALSVAGAVTPSFAAQYPWCSQLFQSSYQRSCAYSNYAQCEQTVSGVGGYCYANPAFAQGRTR